MNSVEKTGFQRFDFVVRLLLAILKQFRKKIWLHFSKMYDRRENFVKRTLRAEFSVLVQTPPKLVVSKKKRDEMVEDLFCSTP